MKYSQWLGILAALALVGACFLPWTYHPDLNKEFTGFFSEQNVYGKPGKAFIALSIVAIIIFLVPRVWAKRLNLLITGIIAAYAIKTFIMFSGCYRGICPEKKAGLYIMLVSAFVMLVMAIVPDMKLREKGKD